MEVIFALNQLTKDYIGVEVNRLVVSLGILLGFLIFRPLITLYFFKIVSRFTNKTESKVDDYIAEAFKRPFKIFITLSGIYLSLRYLSLGYAFDDTLIKLYRSSIVILLAWGFYNLEKMYFTIFEKMGHRLNFKTNKIIKPFISKAIRVTILVITIGIVADELGYNLSTLIAGLGLGGLAVALAAKDTLTNIFGGVVIIMDNPFDIGDWIKTADVEGIVEDINFRSTKIRTFEKAFVTVPNSKLTDQPIVNYSRRGLRRVTFKLGVIYDTTREKLEKCVNAIEDMLVNHPQVDKENIIVRFDGFNDSSLDIFLYFFTKTSDFKEYLTVKQDINFKIMEIIEREGVTIAFPSTSVYFENTLKTEQVSK